LEHRVLAPRNKPSSFSEYAAYERALATLLKRRMQRLNVHRLPSGSSNAPRPAFILERGVDRHPTSAELWREYLAEVAEPPNYDTTDDTDGKKARRRRSSTKRWRKAMTRALRLMPTDASFWIMAGQRAVGEGDWEGARGMYMRGCRFCTGEQDALLWLSFARAELLWLDRMARKMKKESKTAVEVVAEEEDGADQILFDDDEDSDDGGDGTGQGKFVLPEPGAKAPALITEGASQDTATNTPALNGAIVRSITNVATKQKFYTPAVGRDFVTIMASGRFTNIVPDTIEALVGEVLDALLQRFPGDPETVLCWVLHPVLGIKPTTVEFVRGLRETLGRLWGEAEQRSVSDGREAVFRSKLAVVVDEWLATPNLDESLALVFHDLKTKLTSEEPAAVAAASQGQGEVVMA
jgi:U3 small nucleolar RNA-associated protein 6